VPSSIVGERAGIFSSVAMASFHASGERAHKANAAVRVKGRTVRERCRLR